MFGAVGDAPYVSDLLAAVQCFKDTCLVLLEHEDPRGVTILVQVHR
jgi:hypothetical protein